MSAHADFLRSLFAEGRVVLREPPEPGRPPERETAPVLERAFAAHRLGVAGPEIAFDAPVALAAAAVVQRACWFLVDHRQPDAEVEKALTMARPPRTPAEHLSADLLFRYLPQVHQRARALDAADRLTALLATLLRQWPLSGVLADVAEAPLTAPDFDHPGLLLLYAERLARHEKPAWVPEGAGRGYAELVWQELGKDPRTLQRARESA